MKILVAEDDPMFQCLLGGLLRHWGHEPVIARNGHEARAYLEAVDGPRLALLDWVMPGLNGLEVCRQVRSRTTDGYTYIIIVTAKSEPRDAITALEAGADDFVTKPFHPHELRARIDTAQRILALEDSLSHRAFHDQLTGLPNRALLTERFRRGAGVAATDAGMLAVLFIDLDHFKMINDTLGHAAGDAMLKEVTRRLKSCIPETETLARLGGDEFVYLANVQTADAAAALAANVRAALETAIDAGGHRFSTHASIGVSLFPQDGDNLDLLLQNADAAMYEARSRHLNKGFKFFDAETGARHRSRSALQTRLPGALERNEFTMHYQSIFRLRDMTMTGSEALIRWNDPVGGKVSPETFIPVAEETGHIVNIGKWVFEQACQQAKQWEGNRVPGFRVAVNISGSQFSGHELIDMISGTLDRTGADPRMLELEMTETALVRDLERSADTMRALRKLGVRVSLDDFGTGYSSFSYLANLPIDTLKIDRSFLVGINTDARRFSILEAMVVLAHKLGIMVVAEGIEDASQLMAVRDAGCDEAQGFLLAMPALPEGIHRTSGFAVVERMSADLGSLAAHFNSERVTV